MVEANSVSQAANDNTQALFDDGAGHPNPPAVGHGQSPQQMDECCSVTASFKNTSDSSNDIQSLPPDSSWSLPVPFERPVIGHCLSRSIGMPVQEINLDNIEVADIIETSSPRSHDTKRSAPSDLPPTPAAVDVRCSMSSDVQDLKGSFASMDSKSTRSTRRSSFVSMEISDLRYASASEVMRVLLPVRMLTLVIGTGCICAVVATSASDSLYNKAQELFAGNCNSFPKSYGDFKRRQNIGMVVMHTSMAFVGTSCGCILFLIPGLLVRRSDETLSACMVVKLLSIVISTNGFLQTIQAFVRTLETQSIRTVMYAMGSFAVTFICPAMVLAVLWNRGLVKTWTTLGCLLVAAICNVVGMVTFSEGSAKISLGTSIVAVLVVAAEHCWIVAHPLGSPGNVLDLGAQLMLGYANCWLALALPSFFIPVMEGYALGPLASLATWVAAFFLIKKGIFTLADNAVPASWRAFSLFPMLFLEDFVPVIIFADASSLSLEFFITAGALFFWEIIRDCPELKQRLFKYLFCLCATRSKSKHPRSRACMVARTFFEGAVVLLTTILGGSVASEAVGEAAEEAAGEADGEGATGAQKGGIDQEHVKLVMKIDEARQNMVGELTAAFAMLASILTTYASGYKPTLSAANVVILLLAEILSVGICTIFNARSFMQVGMGVPDINESRFVNISMVLAVFGTIMSTFFSFYNGKVMVLIQQGCKT